MSARSRHHTGTEDASASGSTHQACGPPTRAGSTAATTAAAVTARLRYRFPRAVSSRPPRPRLPPRDQIRVLPPSDPRLAVPADARRMLTIVAAALSGLLWL